jgi:S-adenosylmethionine:tRNA ribosyltransferase-isomerase
MRVADFAYDLPQELIAQEPLAERDRSRLLVLDRRTGIATDRMFGDLPALLAPGDLLVLNDSRVFPARLEAHRRTGRRLELLLLGAGPGGAWRGLVRPSKAVRPGEPVVLADGTEVVVGDLEGDGISRALTFPPAIDPFEVAERLGETPLPPYIRRRASPGDRARYQTVFARERGSAAAPTAGLHFTPELLERLQGAGIGLGHVTLHVGAGTFLPLRAEIVEEHRIHAERCAVSPELLAAAARTRAQGGRVVAVGTTVVRALETAARRGDPAKGYAGWTDLFVHPPFAFQAVDALVTNFHLPRSSLLVLVAAFAGTELILRVYREAVARRYRFYSYGDAMLIV